MAKSSKSSESKTKDTDSFSAGSLMSQDSAFAGGSLGGFGSFSGSSSFGQDTGGFSGNTSGVNVRESNVSRNTGSNTATNTRDTYGLLDSTSMYDRGDLMQDFNAAQAEREHRDVLSSGQTISSRGDLLGSGGPMGLADAIGVDTSRAYVSPVGPERMDVLRSMSFSPAPLGLSQTSRTYDTSTQQGIIDLAYDKFRSAGYTHNQVAGILGNFQVESGFRPTVRGDGGAAYGLAQWNDRSKALKSFAQSRGKDWTDPETQIDFALHELNTTEKRAANALRGAKTAEEAARIFSEKFERPGTPHMDRRQTAARGFASSMTDQVQTASAFPGAMDVAVAPDGVQLASVDMPGSNWVAKPLERAFAPGPEAPVDIPNSASQTQTARVTDPVGRLEEKYLAGYADAYPSRIDTGQEAIGALLAGDVAQTPNQRVAGAFEAVGTQPVQVASAGEIAPLTVRTIPVEAADMPDLPAPVGLGSALAQAPAPATAPAQAQTPEGLSSTGRTAIEMGADAAVGFIPGIGLANAAAGLMGLGSAGSFLADNIDYSLKNPDPNFKPTSLADALSNRESREDVPLYIPPTTKAAETKPETKDPIKRLEVSYLSPFPLPSERFGPNASLYR